MRTRAGGSLRWWLVIVAGAAASGCAPGSGGTGVPDNVSLAPAPAPTTAPAPSAEPPPASPPSASPPALTGCMAPAGATTMSYTGTVRAVAGGCLLVDDRSISIAGAQVVRRSGGFSSAAELAAGQRVTVEPEPSDPARARVVTIEDVPASGP